MLVEAANNEKGVPLKGRMMKGDARELAKRGLVFLNKSVSRARIYPAGRYVVWQWEAQKALKRPAAQLRLAL